jgi:hypothetical protein
MSDRKNEIEHWANELLSQAPLLLSKIQLNTSLQSDEEALAGLHEALRFLYLCTQSDSSLTPSLIIDDVWHEFILFTRTYQLFCTEQLGQFVHHQPSNDQMNVINQYEKTLRIYALHYGQPDKRYWPVPSSDIAQCGPCEN